MICAHEGWGQYSGEEGECPPPAEMRSIEGGHECPICFFRVQVLTGADAMTRILSNRETATLDREVR